MASIVDGEASVTWCLAWYMWGHGSLVASIIHRGTTVVCFLTSYMGATLAWWLASYMGGHFSLFSSIVQGVGSHGRLVASMVHGGAPFASLVNKKIWVLIR